MLTRFLFWLSARSGSVFRQLCDCTRPRVTQAGCAEWRTDWSYGRGLDGRTVGDGLLS
jgi:hypothetical protein